MCRKCGEDDYEYAHLSDVAMMLAKVFKESGGQDLPIVVDNNAVAEYRKITHVSHDSVKNQFKLHFDFRSRNGMK